MLGAIIISAVIIAPLLLLLYVYKDIGKYSHIPSPKQSLLWGNAAELKSIDDYPKVILKWWREHGNIFSYRTLWKVDIQIGSYKLAKQILLELDAGENPKYHRNYDAYSFLFGKTVVNTGGAEWKWRRTIFQAAFHSNPISNLPNIVAGSIQETITKLEGLKGKEIDLHQEMFLVSGRVIFRLFFGRDLDYSELGGLENIKQLFLDMVHFLVVYHLLPPLQYMSFLPVYKKAFRAKELLIKMCRKAVVSAIKDIENGTDGEGLIYEILKRGSEGKWTIDELAAEINHFLFAGFDTTTNTLGFMFGILCARPELQDRLHEEAVRDEGEINSSIASKLQLCNSVFLETLRLYPPLPGNLYLEHNTQGTPVFTAREVEIEGYKIPKDTMVTVNYLGMARDEEVYKDPEEFIPERYMQGEDSSAAPVFAFSIGGHQCLGRKIALFEGKIVPAVLMKKFCFTSSTGAPLEMSMGNALIEPKGGMKVIVHPRN